MALYACRALIAKNSALARPATLCPLLLVLRDGEEANYTGVAIIVTVVVLCAVLRVWQE